MKIRTCSLAALGALFLALCAPAAKAQAPAWVYRGWPCFGRTSLHDGMSHRPAQQLSSIKWQAPVDLAPQYSGSNLLIHYGSPVVTRANNVVFPVKVNPFDTIRVEAHRGADGTVLWTEPTDYVLPSSGWVPSVGITLTPRNQVVFPAAGGTVLRRMYADASTSPVARLAFFGIGNYNAAPATYDANVQINTPVTCDASGNLYFGFVVLGATPIGLQSGIARISVSGAGSWTPVTTAANDASITQVVHNCAPAVSRDGNVVYVGVRDGWSNGYLIGIDATTLAPLHRVRLLDPASGSFANLYDEGTASPTIGPDGEVYYGVLENPFFSNHLRGWMLHFDATLTQTKTPGAFGWDNTPSILPSSAVPQYTGSSSYLLCTKYNDYAQGGGQGLNKVAVLDPHATQVDPVTGATVMREVITVVGPTPDPPNGPLAVREWCINACAVDPITRCAMVNSEDGKLYRWDFASNTLTQPVVLTSGIGEAYTPTVIGTDGKAYAINNAILFAVGQ